MKLKPRIIYYKEQSEMSRLGGLNDLLHSSFPIALQLASVCESIEICYFKKKRPTEKVLFDNCVITRTAILLWLSLTVVKCLCNFKYIKMTLGS